MSDSITTLSTFLVWWTLLFTTYAALLFGVDTLLSAYQRRRQARQRLRTALARIDHRAEVSVKRINAAFVVAQRLIGEEARVRRGETR